jgi:hypothetical protein
MRSGQLPFLKSNASLIHPAGMSCSTAFAHSFRAVLARCSQFRRADAVPFNLLLPHFGAPRASRSVPNGLKKM